MKKVLLCATVGFACALSSCSITMPVAVSSNPIGAKTGSATADVYLGVFCFGGDASIQKAAKNGGITRVATVDMKATSILNILNTYTTIVTGE
jgi:hypothetical protein